MRLNLKKTYKLTLSDEELDALIFAVRMGAQSMGASDTKEEAKAMLDDLVTLKEHTL